MQKTMVKLNRCLVFMAIPPWPKRPKPWQVPCSPGCQA
jgi:hypothetical protein